MTGYRKPLPFDAKSVALADSNLIEASAGTGKTYSIALLVLRLVLEQRMPIDKILMVTFTKAAVAELQERVRKFIRQALVAALGQEINDEAIAALVRAQIDARTKEEVVDILQQAVLLLDELSVLTIHSFCQQTLSEFAFETKQQFGAEMFTDMAQLVDQELNKFWRKYVTTMDVALLQQLGFSTLRLELRNVILQHLDGKQYDEYDGQIQYSLDGLDVAALETLQRQYAMESQKFEQQLVATFYELRDEIEAACRSSKSTSKKAFIERLHDAHEFIALLRRSSAVKLIQALPSRFLSLFEEVKSFIDGAGTNLILQSKKRLFYFAIQEVSAAVKDFLLRNNLMGYNDLIQNLHAALLQQPNPSLVAALNEKYKAVFVDEFQDTDREQYEIFITAFTEAILFFIGDPKQSIYAWRKADIFTYFHARSSVKHFYSMNVSYRANAPLVKAMNAFFLPRQEFDTFYFHGEKDSIEYTHVAHHQGKDKGVLYYESLPAVPLSIYKVQKKEEIHWAVARQILQLLSNPKYTMIMDGEERAVKPSDIGILVRRNQEANGIKRCLAQLGIKAVSVNDEKILQTSEAIDLLYVLEAIWEPSLAAINRALLTDFCGYDTDAICRLNQEVVIALFQQYKEIWTSDGVYPALMRFAHEFDVRKQLSSSASGRAERIIANLYQLIELLNQVQSRRDLTPEELMSWMKRGINGMPTEGDEFLTRIESDEEAVKIVTIHKSKGLEYKIVFAPFLDMKATNNFSVQTFRHPATGAYIAKEAVRLSVEEKEWNRIQLEQENRRLIYVAVTRAACKCFVYKNTGRGYGTTGLADMIDALESQQLDDAGIEIGTAPFFENLEWTSPTEVNSYQPAFADHFHLEAENWRRLSYSALSTHSLVLPKERVNVFEDEYAEFVFSQLRFGAVTGNLLHDLLERIDFTNASRWKSIIEKYLKIYVSNAQPQFVQHLLLLLQHITQANIQIGNESFQLQQVSLSKRLSELEFDFSIDNFNVASLVQLSNDERIVQVKQSYENFLQGIMNGKIDLFFQYNNRYYILDWKSNYLGPQLDDYDKDGLLHAMNEHNYHLQYLLYTVAVHRYLTVRLQGYDYERDFGGVVYLFLRGVRKGSGSGVYTARPDYATVLQLQEWLGGNINQT